MTTSTTEAPPARPTISVTTVRKTVAALLENKLISGKALTKLAVTAAPGRGLIWHADSACGTGIPVVCTTAVAVDQFPTALGSIFETLCECVADPDHLARIGSWSDMETVAIAAWLQSEAVPHRTGSPTQRRDALAEFQAITPSADDLKTLTSLRGRRIRKLLAARLSELEADANAEAEREAKREQDRQARIEAQQARKDAMSDGMPWDALTQVFTAQVAAGVPPHVVAAGLAETAYSFVLLENGIEFPGHPMHFECGGPLDDLESTAEGRPMAGGPTRSEGAAKFRLDVDDAIAEYEETNPDLAKMMSRRMHMGHPLDHPWF